MCHQLHAIMVISAFKEFVKYSVLTQAVILLVNTQIHKFTKDHCGTVPIGWCLLYFRCFRVVLLAHGPHKMRKCTNSCSHLIDLLNKI